MVDYSVDSSYDLHFDEQNNFVIVDGIEEFEEDLTIEIDYRFADLIGEQKNLETVSEKIRLLVRRLAQDYDVIDFIRRIVIYEPEDKPESISLEIFYNSGDSFEENI